MISHELGCIMVHVQKTGGSSIRHALQMRQHDAYKHRSATELKAIYRNDHWCAYFKFAFVRNPWDRLVSWWNMIQQNATTGRPMNGFQRFVIARARTFDEFIINCDEEYRDHDGCKWIFRNQLDYISGPGGLLVDFVGRFENLQADFQLVTSRLNLPPIPLVRLNGSSHRHYSTYYSDALRDLVAARYTRDLQTFGYRFERH